MSEIFPYQLVGFLDREPTTGEPVYNGENGWYAQIALKRRFNVGAMSEEELFQMIRDYCLSMQSLKIIVGKFTKTERMPVSILEIEPTDELISFHQGFIEMLSQNIHSRFPERDGDNYYPHITAEYDGKRVINTGLYSGRLFTLNKVWLLKDTGKGDSLAYASFALYGK